MTLKHNHEHNRLDFQLQQEEQQREEERLLH